MGGDRVAGRQRDPGAVAGHDLARGVLDLEEHLHHTGRDVLVDDLGRRHHGGEIGVDVRRGESQAGRSDVDEVTDEEADGTVDAASRVPAGVLVCLCVHPDRVGLAVLQEGVRADVETGVSACPLSGESAVEIDHRIAVNTFELEGDSLRRPFLRNVEPLLVGPLSVPEVARLRSTGVLRGPSSPQHGVMRQGDFLLAGTGDHDRLVNGHERADAPGVVERDADH
nr:hypothetical protein [Streptomyces resistomycificus]